MRCFYFYPGGCKNTHDSRVGLFHDVSAGRQFLVFGWSRCYFQRVKKFNGHVRFSLWGVTLPVSEGIHARNKQPE
jgi:hypothetical protein